MKKKIIILIIVVIFLVGIIVFVNYDKKEKSKRYDEIKREIDTELKRYMYLIAPNCQVDGGSQIITHKDLVYNAGMDKEKFLDVDKKSYCKSYVKPVCVKEGVWDWDIKISCKGYEDNGYVDWDEAFEAKK